MNFDDELARERKLNDLLKAKLAESSVRLESLMALVNSKHDPYREALFREMDTVVATVQVTPLSASPAAAISKSASTPQPQTLITADGYPAEVMKIARFIGQGHKSTKEIGLYLMQEGIQPKKAAKRVMFDYKKYGLFESYQYGQYRLTEKGLQALANQA